MSHDDNKEFDGIRQADNKLPTWYTISFIGTVIFGVFYIAYYIIFGGWSETGQYREEVQAHIKKYGEAAALVSTGGGNPLRGDAKAIAAGAQTFATICAACHKPDGTGLIGPNLTDNVWLHGDNEAALFNTVMEGVKTAELKQVPPKGEMPAHKASLGARKVWEVLAYLTDKNKNIKPGSGK
ncbi:MAG: c-type cytochrome [Spirochaetia bacterium]|nr:c-type cytochrome [Spirochaetia bacterium]